MKIKVNVKLATNNAGDVIDVEDIGGVPTDKFWRKRLRDSAIDGCCEVVSEVAMDVRSIEIEEDDD